MSRKIGSLKRIEQVYGLLEQMDSIALRQAAGLVHEAENAIAGQSGQVREAAGKGRVALAAGDRDEWLLAGAQRDLGALRARQLEVLRVEREAAKDTARAAHGASRMRTEQVKSVIERSGAATAILESRRTQNAVDDRYLSRLRWKELRPEGEGDGNGTKG